VLENILESLKKVGKLNDVEEKEQKELKVSEGGKRLRGFLCEEKENKRGE